MHKYKVFLVDDHPLLREALTALINSQPDMEIWGEADDPQRARPLIAAAAPDIVVADLSFGAGSGLALLSGLKSDRSDVATLVLSVHEESMYAERAIRAGARGYVMKSESAGTILAAIRQIMSGKLYVSPQVADMFTERFVIGKGLSQGSPVEQLSDRELEVFTLMGRGFESRKIAEDLGCSVKTVHAHRARIKEKLNLSSGRELLREAVYWHENVGSLAR